MLKCWRFMPWMMVCALFLLMPELASAARFESHEAIMKAATDYAAISARRAMPGARVSVHAVAPDSRLQLPLCEHPLQVSALSGARVVGNTVVTVRCEGRRPWKLYVPVSIDARLRVLVAAQPLSRGTHLTASSLREAEHDLARLPYGYFTKRSAVVGQVLKRNVRSGSVLTQGMLRPPLLVHRGQVVTLVAGTDDFSVRTQGVALQDGAQGALVRVRNSRSKRIVQGFVIGSGQVRVGG